MTERHTTNVLKHNSRYLSVVDQSFVPSFTNSTGSAYKEKDKEFHRNTTLINKFIGEIIKTDQQMFEGSWRTKKSEENIFFAEFNDKNEGKVRSFLFRS
jgi:hypothetical protein